jgi:hypothetical protein
MKTLRFTLVMPFILLRISILFGQCATYEATASSLHATNKANSFIKSSKDREVLNNPPESLANNIPEATSSSFLYPKAPAPAHTNTSIAYVLPASAQHAALHFYDLQGNQLLCFDILLPGEGKLVILGNTLPPGVYLYSLISDGRLADTQQMILTQ